MDFGQPAACLALLHELHPIDFRTTHATLTRILEGLLEAAPAPNQHLEVLEAARESLAFVQGEMARTYSTHPLPPGRAEDDALARVVGLWKAMARSYARIADADAREGTLEDQRALLAQRRVLYESLALIEYYRGHLELAPGLWHAVPASYDGAVGVSIRSHPGTYDAELVSVTVGAGGHVDISIRDPLGDRTSVFFGHITDDGLTVRRGGR